MVSGEEQALPIQVVLGVPECPGSNSLLSWTGTDQVYAQHLLLTTSHFITNVISYYCLKAKAAQPWAKAHLQSLYLVL